MLYWVMNRWVIINVEQSVTSWCLPQYLRANRRQVLSFIHSAQPEALKHNQLNKIKLYRIRIILIRLGDEMKASSKSSLSNLQVIFHFLQLVCSIENSLSWIWYSCFFLIMNWWTRRHVNQNQNDITPEKRMSRQVFKKRQNQNVYVGKGFWSLLFVCGYFLISQNNIDIFGALFALRSSLLILNYRCKEGAKYVMFIYGLLSCW